MTLSANIYRQIEVLTEDIIKTGLCNDQNFPNILVKNNHVKVSISNMNTTIFLKNISYIDMYEELNRLRAFNLKMIDGAIILLQYEFDADNIVKSRLSFFPDPSLLTYQEEFEIYDGEELYADMIYKQKVCFPIRFDFDCDEKIHKVVEHPKSHLTLGQYMNCRIPVSAPLNPYHFLTFIIRNFYNTAYKKNSNKLSKYNACFEETILDAERKIIHLNIPIIKPII